MRKLICALMVLLSVVLLCGQAYALEQETLQLKYDDRKALTELVGTSAEQVVISDEVVTSFKVGTQTPDDHVLHYDATTGTLYAVGTGTATLTVDGTVYAVEVESAVLSLIMYTGHSVGHGAAGDGRQSVVVEAGQAYSIYDPRYVDFTQTEGYGLGWGSEKRVSNAYQYVSSNGNNHIDAFAPGQNGTRGAGSALAWQWNNLTGEKLWVLNTAVGGSCLNEWMPNASWHSEAYSDYYNTAVKSLRQGITPWAIWACSITAAPMISITLPGLSSPLRPTMKPCGIASPGILPRTWMAMAWQKARSIWAWCLTGWSLSERS